MTEEQNKLAEEIDVLIGRLRMHAGASDTHIPRPLLATAADALAALREREPATEAVPDALMKAADTFRDLVGVLQLLNRPVSAQACEIAEQGCRAALKGKGASQGDEPDMVSLKAKAQVMHDLHDALGVKWGDDPYAEIARLKRIERLYAYPPPDEQKG